ncbi:hypothetical protein C8F04DRAFT_943030, partial [Mycena alexandri]
IQAETECRTLELWIVDLAEFASVKRFADKFEQDGGRLGIVVGSFCPGTKRRRMDGRLV